MVKNSPANAEDKRRRFNPWVGKIPGEGNDNPLQFSCLERFHGIWYGVCVYICVCVCVLLTSVQISIYFSRLGPPLFPFLLFPIFLLPSSPHHDANWVPLVNKDKAI